jgi:protein-L-isoaspartate(D-aspartate) O-methyltransferase
VTAAPDHIPTKLVEQLREGGRMVIPVGNVNQYLTLLVKEKDGVREEQVIPVRFVPMTGEAQAQE